MKVSLECSQWTSEGLIIQGGGREGGSEGEWGQHSLLSPSSELWWLECLVCYAVRLVFSDTAFMFTQVWLRGLWELNNHVVRPVQSSPVQCSGINKWFHCVPPSPPSPSHPEQSLDIFMYNVRGGAVSHVSQWAGLQIWGQWGYNVVIMIRNEIIVRTVKRVTQLCGQLQHSY